MGGNRAGGEIGEAGAAASVRLLEEKARRLGRAGEWGVRALGINSRILEIDPDHVGALTRRARCNVALDDYPAAKADFERALALEPESRVQREYPGDAYARRGIARTLASLGRVEETVRAYESAAEISGDEAQRSRAGLRWLLAELRRNGRTEEAGAVARAPGRMGG